AGAIILGVTNCAEMALDYTSDNPVFGRTLNPHDESRTPGGSSGGCAAAVASCMSAGSLGSDLSGSVRIPAHFCGVAALKPTAGRVPGRGHFPRLEGDYKLGASLGPVARTVEDLALLFRVLAGGLGRAKGVRSLKGKRAVWYADDGSVPVSDEIREAVMRVAAILSSAGMRVEEELPPGVGRGTELWLGLFSSQTRRVVGETYAGREAEAGPAARAILERPAVPEEQARAEWHAARAERERLRAELLKWMKGTPLLVAPVGSVAAFRHGESRRVEVGGRAVSTFRAFGHSQAFNVFDLPAACVPAGRTREGLPVGVQIVGRPFEEATVLAAARAVEEALPNAGLNPL
ncbi:MAG TPA: amidase, partial [Pyrinomonadaceae bacterium]|nr:amidase [Pyrinomonadaceae bacterium]